MLTKFVAIVAGCFFLAKVVIPVIGTEAPPATMDIPSGEWQTQQTQN